MKIEHQAISTNENRLALSRSRSPSPFRCIFVCVHHWLKLRTNIEFYLQLIEMFDRVFAQFSASLEIKLTPIYSHEIGFVLSNEAITHIYHKYTHVLKTTPISALPRTKSNRMQPSNVLFRFFFFSLSFFGFSFVFQAHKLNFSCGMRSFFSGHSTSRIWTLKIKWFRSID